MTNREAISFFKTFAADQTGFSPDDYGLSNLAILHLLLNNRARVIKQAIDERWRLSHQTIQTLACIGLEEADMVEFKGYEKSGCLWMRSIDVVPSSIATFGTYSIIGGENFDFVEWDKLRHKMSSRSRAIRDGRYWTYRNIGDGLRIYLLNTEFLESVSQTGVYENPISADTYPRCGEVDPVKKCSPLDLDFHTQEDLMERILTKSMVEYLQRIKAVGADLLNDDTYNSQGAGNPKA